MLMMRLLEIIAIVLILRVVVTAAYRLLVRPSGKAPRAPRSKRFDPRDSTIVDGKYTEVK